MSSAPIPNVRSMAAQWSRRIVRELGIAERVKVRHVQGQTRVEIEDEIPHLSPRHLHRPRYRITTQRLFLDPAAHKNRTQRHEIMRDATKARGRALFCQDLRRAHVLAAVSFHIDKARSHPVLVTDLSLSQLSAHDNAMALFAAHTLLSYLLEVAAKDGRPGEIGFVPPNATQRDLAGAIGFAPCPRPSVVSGPGTYMCFRRADDQDSGR